MEELRGWLEIVRDVGALAVLAFTLWLLFGYLRGNGRGGGRDGEKGWAQTEAIAVLWFLIVLGVVLLGFAPRAQPQAPANVVRPWDGITVHSTWPVGTRRIECETPGLAAGAVGAIDGETPDPAEVTFPLSFPVLEVRCRSCNEAGCSALSPNALEISERRRADCNGDARVNVSDIVCVGLAIYAGG